MEENPGAAVSDLSSIADRDSNIVITTNRLTKVYGKLVAVNDLHLEVVRGDVFGFLGPNGSGKTTTIRMLLGLIQPTAGRAVIFGMDTSTHMSSILPHIGAIVETPVFYPYLSGLDNLRVIATASGMVSHPVNHRRIDEVLDLVELRSAAKMAYRKYSLGMKQRLGIAAALLTDPQLVLLDEPTNGLDPAGMFEIRQLIHRLSGLGKTIFLSSHLLNEVQQVCNRVAILQKGNLIKQGNVRDLLLGTEQIMVCMNTGEDLQSAFNVLQSAREQGADWLTEVRIETNRRGEPMLRIHAPRVRSAEINAMLARNNLYAAELHPFEGSLEEVYLELTSGSPSNGSDIGAAARGGRLIAPTASVPASVTPSNLSWPPAGNPSSQTNDNQTRGNQ
ncbi:MAG TPA: ATP-binding cassette domain-containing protein [Ktedonobacteraceae bacterium]|jgi:ABC-2 type transport system ATP-binding protein|nr:ATP-binding cassette domain-containing protein [Ktedonobacteraceae bacterium]